MTASTSWSPQRAARAGNPDAVRLATVSAVVLTLNEEVHARQRLEQLAWCDERTAVDVQDWTQ